MWRDAASEVERELGDGEYDGNEFHESGCVLYMYGPNADDPSVAVEPMARPSLLVKGGCAVVRYGLAERAR